jgi:SPP1 gp7 family putative phage head morphogenesis protein
VSDEEPEAEPATDEETDPVWAAVWKTIIGDAGQSLGDMTDLFLAGITVGVIKSLKASRALDEPPAEAVARLEGLKDSKARRAGVRVIVSTGVQTSAHVIFDRTVRKLFPKYIWVSILDSVTSNICRRLNRQVFVFGRGPVPPAHPHCRSTIAPWRNGGGPILDETLAAWLARQSAADKVGLLSPEPLTIEQYAKKVLAHGTQNQNQ